MPVRRSGPSLEFKFCKPSVDLLNNTSATTNPHLLSLFNRLDTVGAVCVYHSQNSKRGLSQSSEPN